MWFTVYLFPQGMPGARGTKGIKGEEGEQGMMVCSCVCMICMCVCLFVCMYRMCNVYNLSYPCRILECVH